MLAPPTLPTFRVGADVNDDSSHVDVLPKVLCPVRQRVYRRGAGVRAVFGWSAGAPTSIEVAVDGVSGKASSSRAGHPRGRCRGQASRPHVITMASMAAHRRSTVSPPHQPGTLGRGVAADSWARTRLAMPKASQRLQPPLGRS